MTKKKRSERIIAIVSGDGNTSYAIYADDTPGRQGVYLTHLERTGNQAQALIRAGATVVIRKRWREDPTFREKERDARYKASAKYTNKIAQAAMKGDWKAAAYLAERLNPEDLGKVEQHSVEFVAPPAINRGGGTPTPVVKMRPLDADEVEGEFREVADATTETERTREADPTGESERLSGPDTTTAEAQEPQADGSDDLGHPPANAVQLPRHPGHEPDGGA